jgi:HSP20 family protein
MFPLTKWSPSRELLSLQREMDDLVNRVFGRGEREMPFLPTFGRYNFPAIDCVREGNNVKVHAELPGIDPKDVEITVTGNLLTIKGERKTEKKVEEEDYFLHEIGLGTFERSITLPVEVNTEHIKANYKKGLLEITMPAQTALKGKKIEITMEEEPKRIKAA